MKDLVAEPNLPASTEAAYRPTPPVGTVPDLSQPLPPELQKFSQATLGIANLPLYKWLRPPYEEGFHDSVQRQLKEFERFKSISREVKERIFPRVSESIAQIQAYQAWQLVYKEDFLDRGTGLALILGVASAILSAFIWFTSRGGLPGGLRGLPGLFVFLAVAMGCFVLYNWIVYRLWKWRYGYPSLSFLILLAVSTLGITALRDRLNPAVQSQNAWEGLMIGLIGGWVFLATILLTYFVAKLMIALANRRKVHLYPEEEIIQSLCYALALVDDGSDPLPRKFDRRELVRVLGWIGQQIEKELFQKWSGQDMEINLWLQKRMCAMAADFRRMQQTVLLPTNLQEHEKLVQQLAEKLVNAADDNWGLFEYIESGDLKPGRMNGLLSSFQTVMGFSFPLLIILALELFPTIPIGDAVRNSIYTTAIGWLLVNIVGWLDPKYETRLGGVKILTEAIMPKE